MHWARILSTLLGSALVQAVGPTRTTKRNNNAPASPKFVSSQGGRFSVNGSEFPFVGTNAYWLTALNSDDDLADIFANMSAAGVKVVRTWGFNDVDVIPEVGNWFQLIANGTTTVNNGTNGLPRLDAVIKQAEAFGIYVMVTLTNNWNPRPLFDNLTAGIDNLTSIVDSPNRRRDVTPGTNNTLPRNTLSNDYGGMDTYVRQFGLFNHDDFYTNETIIATFENYTTQVVSRYVNSPAIFAWEVANDPRCNSSLSAKATCNTTTITAWLDRVSNHIKSIDTNHLVSAGNQGFFCAECPKLFPRVPPPPGPSAVPAARRSFPKLTRASLLQEKRQLRKRAIAAQPRSTDAGGIRIRGKWISTPTRRQDVNDVGVGPAFDGSQGVDCEDIMNIPQIGFGTFQLFPDQNIYGPDDPTLSPLNNTIQLGIEWIKRQAQISQIFGKPISLTGFGLVTQQNSPFFVPFNTTVAPFGPDQGSTPAGVPYGVTDAERDDAYSRWLDAGIASGLQGIMQYQWGQANLTAADGTAISPDTNTTAQTPDVAETGISPNDGYSIQGTGKEEVQGVLREASDRVEQSVAG